MKTIRLAATLAIALAGSTAAIAAPRGTFSDSVGGYQPGQWFNCTILMPGPSRTGPCWVRQPDMG